MRAVQAAPLLAGRLAQLEDHGERRHAAEAALGLGGPEAHGRKGAFDGIGGANVLPVLGREVVEGVVRRRRLTPQTLVMSWVSMPTGVEHPRRTNGTAHWGTGPQHRKRSSRKGLIRSSFNGDYDRIRRSLDIESNLIRWYRSWGQVRSSQPRRRDSNKMTSAKPGTVQTKQKTNVCRSRSYKLRISGRSSI